MTMRNKKAQGYVERGLVFLAIWLISSIVWAFWFDGIYVPTIGCLTAIGAISVINITFSGRNN